MKIETVEIIIIIIYSMSVLNQKIKINTYLKLHHLITILTIIIRGKDYRIKLGS